MAQESEHFAAEWLALREPADHGARRTDLAAALAERYAGKGEIAVVDLGAGAGNNLRWLAPRLGVGQRWLLVDHDRSLLDIARQRSLAGLAEGLPLTVETRCSELAPLSEGSLEGADLVTASAWFDLVSAEWIKAFAEALGRSGAAGLFALTVDGRRGFVGPDGCSVDGDDDRRATELFNLHQRRPKGLGRALGPEAAAALPAALKAAGFEVRVERSDWRLGAGAPRTRELGAALIDDWAEAAAEAAGEAGAWIPRWHRERRAAIEAGEIGLVVGHVDVLALPERP